MILLIGDDKTIPDALTDFLSAQGFNIELASCKADAVCFVENFMTFVLV